MFFSLQILFMEIQKYTSWNTWCLFQKLVPDNWSVKHFHYWGKRPFLWDSLFSTFYSQNPSLCWFPLEILTVTAFLKQEISLLGKRKCFYKNNRKNLHYSVHHLGTHSCCPQLAKDLTTKMSVHFSLRKRSIFGSSLCWFPLENANCYDFSAGKKKMFFIKETENSFTI